MRRRVVFVLLVLTSACMHRMHSTSALLLSSENGRLFLQADCVPGRGPCIPGEPMAALDYVERRYQNFRESGFIDLDSDMRLRVVGPVMRPGSESSPVIASAASRTGPTRLDIAVLGSADLLGYETAIYSLRASQHGVIGGLASIEVKPIAGSETDLPKTDYLRFPPSPDFLRLYFQLQRSDFNHDSALLAAESLSALDEASRRFEKDPSSVCDTKKENLDRVRCTTLPRGVVMTPEFAVRARDRVIYMAIESRLKDVLRAAGERDPAALIKTLRISRRLGARQVPIRFDRFSDAVLDLPMAGGDQVTW